MLENKVVRKGFDRKYVLESNSSHTEWQRLHNKELIICTPRRTLFGWPNQEEWDGLGMWHVWKTGEVHVGFWWGDRLLGLGMQGLNQSSSRYAQVVDSCKCGNARFYLDFHREYEAKEYIIPHLWVSHPHCRAASQDQVRNCSRLQLWADFPGARSLQARVLLPCLGESLHVQSYRVLSEWRCDTRQCHSATCCSRHICQHQFQDELFRVSRPSRTGIIAATDSVVG